MNGDPTMWGAHYCAPGFKPLDTAPQKPLHRDRFR